MLPLRDNVRSTSFPIMNWLLIGVNTLVFLLQASLEPVDLHRLISTLGMTPTKLISLEPVSWITLFTSMFLHGGWFHFLSNMWTLYIFGDNVEDRMGPGRYLSFYILSGVIANLLQALVFPGSTIPAIGASGAIAGVLGGYFLLYPRARIITLIPVFVLPWMVEIYAFFYLGFWFFAQLYSGLFSLSMPTGASMGGVAWWAHIGGFIFGLFTVRIFTYRHPAYYRQYPDEFWPY